MKLMTRKLLSMSVGLAVCGLAGCADTDKSDAKGFFRPVEEQGRMTNVFAMQAATGAAEDATLQAFHFTGASLNSLGEEKLDLLAAASEDPEAEVVVYLNLADDDKATASRREAVTTYLTEDCSIGESQVKIELGRNPNALTPAGVGMTRLAKTETGSAVAGGDPASDSPAGADPFK
jgi:hypothetical protein